MSTLTLAPAFDQDAFDQDAFDRDHGREPRRTPERTAPRRSTVRLTRRGRLSLFMASLTALLGASVALGAGAVGTEEAEPTRTVTVTPGDTLWEIAAGVAADTGQADVRDVISDIEQLNHLESPALMVGQRLQVPVEE